MLPEISCEAEIADALRVVLHSLFAHVLGTGRCATLQAAMFGRLGVAVTQLLDSNGKLSTSCGWRCCCLQPDDGHEQAHPGFGW